MWKRPLITYRPASSAGNLYYVKLKTDSGTLYKLGFTSLESVHARLSFGGAGDEKLIDKVLFFEYFEDAFDIEDRFHSLFESKAVFSKKYPKAHAPLFNNGQSELYAEDILMLDPDYSSTQAESVIRNLKISDYMNRGMTHQSATDKLDFEKNLEKILWIAFYPLFLIFKGIFWFWDRFIADKNELQRVKKDRENARRGAEHEKNKLIERLKKTQSLRVLQEDLRLQELRETVLSRIKNQKDT
jgi:hypothetical protein